MDRRRFLRSVGVAAAAGLLPRRTRAARRPEGRCNFVFILVDDLGWADLGCYGADLHETPNIDRLARQSVRFTDAYAAAPVCTPTRASIMTGKAPARLNMTIWHEASANPPQHRKVIPPVVEGNLPQEEVTVAEVLHDAGYRTMHVGKWHLGDAAHYPENQGFDVNIGGSFWGCPATFFHPYRGRFGRDELRYVPGLHGGRTGEYLTDRLTDEAIKLMERSKDRPFLLHLAFYTVHTPIEGKAKLVEHYRRKRREGLNHQNATYAAMVHSLDENVGRVLSKIDELGLADNTVVLLMSDNGGFINKYKGETVTNNAPLRSGKGSLYEGGIRVPLLVRRPDTKPGACRHPVSSIDFYPTMLELAGLTGDAKHNADVDGISLVPLLNNPDGTLKRDALYFHYPHYYSTTTPVSAVRRGDWKLLEFFEDGHVELYDLARDRSESSNLAAEKPEKAAELKKLLHAWRNEVDAPMPKPNPNYKPRKKPR